MIGNRTPLSPCLKSNTPAGDYFSRSLCCRRLDTIYISLVKMASLEKHPLHQIFTKFTATTSISDFPCLFSFPLSIRALNDGILQSLNQVFLLFCRSTENFWQRHDDQDHILLCTFTREYYALISLTKSNGKGSWTWRGWPGARTWMLRQRAVQWQTTTNYNNSVDFPF